ncbi:MAG: hypothetical protein Q7K45_04055 [Nanoarchaeota archaeon]|nr:hypothetical protein [Nanoarchaeota archaeon]
MQNHSDLIHRVGEMIKNTPPAQKAGDIYTLGTFERAMRNLQHPFSGDYLPEPSQEELRQAVKTVQEAFGKRAFLITPEGNLEGIVQPSGDVGVYFTHYEGSRAARHLFSHEHLKVEQREPVYEFSAASLGGCFPLYGVENLSAKYSLWKVGVERKTNKPR